MSQSHPTTITTTEAQNNFGKYLRQARLYKKPIVVSRHNKPVVVILDYAEWQKNVAREPEPARPAWYDKVVKNAERIRASGKKQTDAVTLIRQLREEH